MYEMTHVYAHGSRHCDVNCVFHPEDDVAFRSSNGGLLLLRENRSRLFHETKRVGCIYIGLLWSRPEQSSFVLRYEKLEEKFLATTTLL